MKLEQTAILTPVPVPAAAGSPLAVPAAEPAGLARADSLSVGYLRAFITVMVLGHHAIIAYNPFLPVQKPAASLLAEPGWWQAFPVLDSQRWVGFGLLNAFNDMFFMALMFFLSGLFVSSSLQRKVSGAFLRSRALRLGVPFVVAAGLIGRAYYPAYLQATARPAFGDF